MGTALRRYSPLRFPTTPRAGRAAERRDRTSSKEYPICACLTYPSAATDRTCIPGRGFSIALSSEACFCICRAWSVTNAIFRPRQFVAWSDPSSTALKRFFTLLRALTNARWMVVSGVLPRPREEWKSVNHIKCQPMAVPNSCSLPLPTRIAFVGNYLPRQCGIATSTTDLCTTLATEYGAGRLFAIPVNDPESSYDYLSRCAWNWSKRIRPPMSGLRNS